MTGAALGAYVGAPVGHPQYKTCMDDVWPDGDGSFHLGGATSYTVDQLAEQMDMVDMGSRGKNVPRHRGNHRRHLTSKAT